MMAVVESARRYAWRLCRLNSAALAHHNTASDKVARYLAPQVWTAAASEARRRFGLKWRRGLNQALFTRRESGVALRLSPQSKATLSLALPAAKG